MNTSSRSLRAFLARALLLPALLAPLAVPCAAQAPLTGTPVLPSEAGTYYYQGFDQDGGRYVYVSPGANPAAAGTFMVDPSGNLLGSTSGTYFYVDPSAAGTAGAPTGYPVSTPYRSVSTGSFTSFQFYNAHSGFFALSSGTDSDGNPIFQPDFSARSGTYTASDVTFKLSGNAGDGSGIWLVGYTDWTVNTGTTNPSNGALMNTGTVLAQGTAIHPVTFIGTNVNAISEVSDNGSRQAVSIRSGASFFLYGGTISKTAAAGSDGSETVYIIGNQEGRGSTASFYGEDLTIISNGQALETFNSGNGRTTIELYRSTITSTITAANANAQVVNLNDQQAQGGAHFYGEEIAINVNNSNGTVTSPIRVFAFGYGDNSITLKDSTVTSNGKGAIFRWKTSEGTGGNAGGNEAMHDGNTSTVTLENTSITTTGSFAPIFQQTGRFGKAVVTGGTLSALGPMSPIIRLAGANDAQDEARFTGLFTNVLLEAPLSSAIDLDIRVRDSNYGEDTGGVSKEVTTLISDAWDLIFQSSTLNAAQAIRLAVAGAVGSPFANETKVTVRDSEFNGSINMVVNGEGTAAQMLETTGANLRLKGERSTFTGGFSLDGIETARKYHEAELYLIDSVFGTAGAPAPITMQNRGEVVVKFENTPMVGDFTLSGSTRTNLDLRSSPVTGSISLAGTAILRNSPGLDLFNRAATVRDSSISGGFSLAGGSSLDLDFTGNTTVSGGVVAAGTATATLRFRDSTSLAGGINISGSSSVTVILSSVDQLAGDIDVNDRARLTLATFAGTPIRLDRDFDLGGTWVIAGKVTLAGALDLTNPLATLSIASAAKDSLILSSGLTGNGRLDIQSIDGASLGLSEFRVIRDDTGTFITANPEPLILSHPVDYGLAAYNLENRADGAYLVGGLSAGSFSTGGAAVFNSHALAAEDWFAALEPLQRHAADLRERALADPKAHSKARFDKGALWVTGRANDATTDLPGGTRDFTQRTLGISAGADAHYDLANALLVTGVFADTATTARDFTGAADGRSVSVGGGFHALWLHEKGIFVAGVARFDTTNTTFDTHNPTNQLIGDYHAQSGGLSLQAGWRLDKKTLSFIPDAWWFEPSLQAGLAKLAGFDYATESTRAETNRIDISVGSTKAFQYRATLAAGRDLSKNWRVRASLAYADVDADGGKLNATGIPDPVSILLSGSRVEAALGVTRLVGKYGRVHLDYLYTRSDADFTRPWTVSLGYSHLW
jgi:outer membrane autotransporter protein